MWCECYRDWHVLFSILFSFSKHFQRIHNQKISTFKTYLSITSFELLIGKKKSWLKLNIIHNSSKIKLRTLVLGKIKKVWQLISFNFLVFERINKQILLFYWQALIWKRGGLLTVLSISKDSKYLINSL